MERKSLMLSLFGLNALFYFLDIFVMYKRYFDDPMKYAGMFDFEIVYSFLLSLFLMIPTIMAYFVLFNYLKEKERTQLVGQMLMITLINMVFVLVATIYTAQV